MKIDIKMKASRLLIAGLFAAGIGLAGCEKPVDQQFPPAERGSNASEQSAEEAAEKPMQPTMAEKEATRGESNWFGGEVYEGEPALETTAALIEAGGGARAFSFERALVSMLGEELVVEEVEKLNEQYGEDEVEQFVEGMDFAVQDALKYASQRGIELPEAPEDLRGVRLAETLIKAGTTSDGTFWSGYLFDKTLSHEIHNLVMADIDQEFGRASDELTHKILNQAMYDVAQTLDMKDVKLASLH